MGSWRECTSQGLRQHGDGVRVHALHHVHRFRVYRHFVTWKATAVSGGVLLCCICRNTQAGGRFKV